MDLQPNTKCLSKNVAIEISYSPLFHGSLLILTTRKSLNLKNLAKHLLVLTMFIQRTDNLAKLIGTTIILTFANWEHKVQ